MYILFLDTTHEQTRIALYDARGTCVSVMNTFVALDIHAQLLATIVRMIKPFGDWSVVQGVAVVPGPGRFTSVRLGIVAANALGYALDIPVVVVADDQYIPFSKFMRTKFKPVAPVYGKAPNITVKH